VQAPVTLTRLDSRYPSRLAHFPRAPASIRWQGGLVEAAATVAIVGSRKATAGALAFATELARALVRAGVVVVSGGASGVDTAAHAGALRAGGRTWAVAATGPERCYPACNAELFQLIARGPGAMLWPFAGGDHGAFLGRNRVLVSLSDAVVVVQAGLQSGALHAASCARKLGRPLWVVPAAPWMGGFEGSLSLLEGGARPLTSTDALVQSLGIAISKAPTASTESAPTPAAGPDNYRSEYRLLESMSHVPLHVDAIVARASQSAQAVAAALLTLALENVVVEGPPGFFRRR
jgi:DNA processing protein